MTMKLYSDSSVTEIANSIRRSNGTETTYKIGQMASAINSAFSNTLTYIPTNTFDGTSNQVEIIFDAASLPFKKLVIDGFSSQTGTPTISNKVDVTNINSATITAEDENNNSRVKVINFAGYELYKIQDGTKDTLRIENNHLYIDKRVKKLRLTKDMSWQIYPAKNGAFCASFASDYGVEKLNYNMYSSHFTPSTTTWDSNYKFGWGSASPNTTLWVTFNSTTSEFNSAAAFKNWLDENECYIVAKATTPQTIDLGEINTLALFDGTNNITLTTSVNTDYLLEYWKDYKKDKPYIELEYIESNGTEYIETNLTYDNNNNYNFESDIAFITNSEQYYGWDAGGAFGKTSTNKWTTGNDASNSSVSLNTKYNVKLDVNSNTNTSTLYVDDSSLLSRNNSNLSNYALLYGYPIFAIRSQSNITKNSIRIYYFKIYRNNILVFNFIPVKRKSDNEICLYDKVSNTFFTNQGTGSFTAGPEKT